MIMGTESISMASVLDSITQHDAFYNAKNGTRTDILTFGIDKPDSELDAEIEKYERRVQEQRVQLESAQQRSTLLTGITVPSPDLGTRLKQLETIKMAYDYLLSREPDLPNPTSRLPGVMAADAIKKAIADNKVAIELALEQIQSIEEQMKMEQGNLADANALSQTLDVRLGELESSQTKQRGRPLNERYRDILRTRTQRRNDLIMRTRELRENMDMFIKDHLGAMLLAEELGGPVVGELADIDEDMLTAGFSAQGKPRKVNTNSSNSRRQLRLDELWGFGNKDNDGAEPDSEHQATYEDMLGLIDALYNALQGTSDTGTYVELPRDSAAARFLVRAKVAQYHPRDARRLRLVDFGRELD